jgi:hypothetical protein
MASNINANNIDGTYPVAGVDNDSQGFRTNFTNIKNNLSYAKTEIEDLQSKVILKTALSGTTLNNNFAGSVISGAEIKDFRETESDLGTVAGSVVLNHSVAHYYKVTTSTNVTPTFTNLPIAGKIGRIRLQVIVSTISTTLTLTGLNLIDAADIQGYSSGVITFTETGTYYFEFITNDQGSSFHIQDLTRTRNRITSNAYVLGNLMVTGDIIPNFTYANISPAGTDPLQVTNTLILSSSGTITAQTVYFPASTVAKNGETITFSSNVNISSLKTISNGAAINGNISGSYTANIPSKWQYVSSATSWFKIA